ncbi:glutamate decarboxylase [Desulfosarcina sp. BuS5]|uniref:pyridoxal-dependent aspartate 1-decarboxylase PanP n=1 Tax=Desulfosarcina sp. BuS5 TaxID=933262 RepID=UPI0005566881|nr:putative pyridoxal-dependent aspartate 1-decarboxylase [Desulfosarcina sp. BuS5]WDN87382.1 glutamate decarboxylase [Desulfosarcina sp. BuS5]
MHNKKTGPNKEKKKLVADWSSLIRVFLRPENETSRNTLVKYMRPILFGLHDFLNQHVGVTRKFSLKDMANYFTSSILSEQPEKKLDDVITDLIENIAPHAVNIASPYFVGHMTSAIPFFMVHLKTIVTALNQNVVKLETSKVVSVLEKQVIAKIHRLLYQKEDTFYDENIQNAHTTLGCFVEDGTLANLTAMWVARDNLLPPTKEGFEGVESEGILAVYNAYGIERCVVLVSRLGHLSLRKAGGLLGIGNKNVIPVDVDEHNRIKLDSLNNIIKDIKKDEKNTKILAIVGIAGTTETGTIDPLKELGSICAENNIHYHVDAAWGGPTIMSKKYRHLLKGIELADSITIDGHKQLYMPMTCGMVYFKDPARMDAVAYHSNYINRPGSVDLGIKSVAGSREANSIILDSALKIMGTQGYALLIEHSIETAVKFAQEIKNRPDFQLITEPQLNIITYRICPLSIQQQLDYADHEQRKAINQRLNEITRIIQILQREAGNSFVSRTTLLIGNSHKEEIVVFRCVLMNPLTDMTILRKILDEQEKIYRMILPEDR